VKVFSTACDSASINSTVLAWWSFGFIFNRGNRKVGCVGITVMFFLLKISCLKRKCFVVINSQFFCRQSSGRSLRTFSHSHPHNSLWKYIISFPIYLRSDVSQFSGPAKKKIYTDNCCDYLNECTHLRLHVTCTGVTSLFPS
jgi:hypothetical protein